ncbi:MAG: TetR/AcrR family transcriptional regulator [Spirochaetes bacterium]|nr:TetR/AcrR family transcriptional regulator [Spirochaetota bacterium]
MKSTKKTLYGNIKKRERELRREVIIEAAQRVFARKPFNKVSIRDIARQAGISHALIYRYFSNKQSIFVEAFLRGVQELVPLINEASAKGIEAVAETYVRFLIDHDELFRMMTHFMLDGNLKGESVKKLNAVARSLLDCLNRFFESAQQKIHARYLAHAFFASLNGVLISFRDYPGRTQNEITAHMLRLGNIIAKKLTQ